MAFYNKMIDKTIKEHNVKIYGELNMFLKTSTDKLNAIAEKISMQKADRLGNSLGNSIQKEQAS